VISQNKRGINLLEKSLTDDFWVVRPYQIHDNNKLITAQAADEIIDFNHSLQPNTHFDKEAIASFVSELIVYSFESIEVNKEYDD
jgi:hypothetical protein